MSVCLFPTHCVCAELLVSGLTRRLDKCAVFSPFKGHDTKTSIRRTSQHTLCPRQAKVRSPLGNIPSNWCWAPPPSNLDVLVTRQAKKSQELTGASMKELVWIQKVLPGPLNCAGTRQNSKNIVGHIRLKRNQCLCL